MQPNTTLLLPLSERDKIGNRNTTNKKPNFFSPFPSYDVLRSWFTSQSDYRLHYFTLIEISLPMSYKTIHWNKLSENKKSPQKCQRQFAIDTSWKHVLENRARWRIFSRLVSQSRTRTQGPKTAASLSKSAVNKNHNEPYQQHLYTENVGKTLIHHQGIAPDFLMWPSVISVEISILICTQYVSFESNTLCSLVMFRQRAMVQRDGKHCHRVKWVVVTKRVFWRFFNHKQALFILLLLLKWGQTKKDIISNEKEKPSAVSGSYQLSLSRLYDMQHVQQSLHFLRIFTNWVLLFAISNVFL